MGKSTRVCFNSQKNVRDSCQVTRGTESPRKPFPASTPPHGYPYRANMAVAAAAVSGAAVAHSETCQLHSAILCNKGSA